MKVKFPDVEEALELFAETTSKLYSVPGVKPVSATECVVVSVLFKADCDP